MEGGDALPDVAVAQAMHRSRGRLLSCLIGQVGDFQLAEDCLQEAALSAVTHWARTGAPASPEAWLLKAARRKAIDRFRRDRLLAERKGEYALLLEQDEMEIAEDKQEIPDERLRLIFTCCHPALDPKTRVALTLNTLCGLTTQEVARAYLDSREAMAQRLVRAKRKIRQARIPYSVPDADQWPERLATVLEVAYLIFNEGYSAMQGEDYVRPALSAEAIRIARLLDRLRPGESEIEGLLALMLLHESRSPARMDASGAMIPLDAQDRTLWDRSLIAEGDALVVRALRRGRPGAFALQAAISAVHASAARFEDTDWAQIVLLYRELAARSANPVVLLNMAVAQSYVQGVEAALVRVRALSVRLERYQPYHACLADLWRRAGNVEAAERSYRRAIDLSANEPERRLLATRLAALAG